MFGAKIKLVTGYPGTNEITLAMERGEVDGLCGLSWSTMKGRHPHWMQGQEDQHPDPGRAQEGARTADVPLGKRPRHQPEQLQILKLFLTSQDMARPFAAPPGIPADRKAALIAGFDAP